MSVGRSTSTSTSKTDRPSPSYSRHPFPNSSTSSSSNSSSRRQVWSPAPTRETFKDLLIFEERLKQNAERLQKQRRKYEAFLISICLLIIWFAYKVFVLPSIYSLVHYGHVALLLVSLVTLALFFATGMYSEKIAYAYRFVPQANRALRPLNIYLNTRKRSWISYLSLFRFAAAPPTAQPPSLTTSPKPSSPTNSPPSSPTLTTNDKSLPSLVERPSSRRSSISSSTSSTTTTGTIRSSRSQRSPPISRSPSPPPAQDAVTRTLPPQRSTSVKRANTAGVPLPPIPPAQNPRGELIFSSRVSPQFREGYERYRSEWEKRRNEASSSFSSATGNSNGWFGWILSNGEKGKSTGKEGNHIQGNGNERVGRTPGARKRTSSSAASSRQVSPARSSTSSINTTGPATMTGGSGSRRTSPNRLANRSRSGSIISLESGAGISRSASPVSNSIDEDEKEELVTDTTSGVASTGEEGLK